MAAPPRIDTGEVRDGRVAFPAWTAATEQQGGGPPVLLPPAERVGFAVVGLGRLSLENILPAFGACKKARLAALVSGTSDKAGLTAHAYGLPPDAVLDYAGFERLAERKDVQAVYIVLPNAMHRDFTVRAAGIGLHVLCEKPMAADADEGEAMIAACARAGRKLMIAYRCQYEPYNRAVRRLVRDRTFGRVGVITALNMQNMAHPEQWRLKQALADGGSLVDVGIYCLNAARFLTGEEPVEVYAQTASPPGDPRFAEIEDVASFMLRFPSGVIANCVSSYSLHQRRLLTVQTEGAAIQLDNAFAYEGQRLTVSHLVGEAETAEERRLFARDQFATEIDHMADCILADRMPHTPGEEGLQDHRVIAAIYRSARSRTPVTLPEVEGLDTTRGPEPENGR